MSTIIAHMLEKIFLSKARGEILRLLFGVNRESMHVREIERQTCLSYTAVRQELKKLAVLDLVNARINGNRTYYSANEEHPLFNEFHHIVLKTDGLVDILRGVLNRKGIRSAFVYDSIAKGQDKARSDIDLFVIGTISSRKLSDLLYGIEDDLGRELNSIVRTVSELKESLAKGDPFVREVITQPKIFVIGNQDELDALIE